MESTVHETRASQWNAMKPFSSCVTRGKHFSIPSVFPAKKNLPKFAVWSFWLNLAHLSFSIAWFHLCSLDCVKPLVMSLQQLHNRESDIWNSSCRGHCLQHHLRYLSLRHAAHCPDGHVHICQTCKQTVFIWNHWACKIRAISAIRKQGG